MKIAENLQMELSNVPTSMSWGKVQSSEGELTLLMISTPVGSWAFFMPHQMVLDLEKGMHEMGSPIQVAKGMPKLDGGKLS